MKISKYSVFQFSIYIAFFILFSGYYVGLITWVNVAGGATRTLTVPLRLVILLFLLFAFLLRGRWSFPALVNFFILFSLIYFTRIFHEILSGGNNFHISETQFLLYYTGFVFFPFLLISQTKFDDKSYQNIFHAILFSTLILSVLTFIYYGSLLGIVGRISQAITRDENYISPLALSYTGAIGIGVGAIFLITNKKIRKKQQIFVLATIILSAIPFFLGASRGSIFALALPFVFMVYKMESFKNKFYITIVTIIAGLLIVVISEKLGSGLIERFTNIQADIKSGKSSAIRLAMWIDSIQQFWQNPLFGNSLENKTFNGYPHNIFLEVLISTGILGFIPFIILIYKGFKYSWRIFKSTPKYAWLATLFIQSLVQYMFSGSLYSASWVFVSLILVIVFNQKH